MIVMLGCLEIYTEISDNIVETVEFGKSQELLGINKVANSMLVIIYGRT